MPHDAVSWLSPLLVLGAYALGSVSSAIVICRLMGLPDPRLGGSGNPGATNVLRLGGKKAAALTLVGDLGKGLIPVLAARAVGLADWWLAAVAMAAFLGHLYPVWFRFRGGKGVATALGVCLGLDVLFGAALLAIWLAVAALFRRSSLAALTATVAAPFLATFLMPGTVWLAFTILLAVLVILRHRDNIRRLLTGQERPFRK